MGTRMTGWGTEGEMEGRRPAALFAVIAATLLALFAATVALPHDPYVRFQQLAHTLQYRSQWVYERITFDKAPIEVAVIGNSRLGAGVSGPQLQSALSRQAGRHVGVANLSLPQEGRNIHYEVVRRLLAAHPEVKLIVLSAIEQMPRDGHPAFRELADARDVLDAPLVLNRDWANDVAALPYRQISLFVQSLWPAAFGDRTTLDSTTYPGTDFDTTLSQTLPDGRIVDRDSIPLQSELARAARERVDTITPPVLPAAVADYEFAMERRYTRATAALARAKGVSILFLYLPIYGDHGAMADRAFYQAIGPVLEPRFLANDYRLYSDYGHLNVYGSRLVAPWLADRIARLSRAGRVRAVAPR